MSIKKQFIALCFIFVLPFIFLGCEHAEPEKEKPKTKEPVENMQLTSNRNELNVDTIRRLKKATVFIKTSVGSGSGFVVETLAGQKKIITNYHVIEVPQRASKEIEIVFNSGSGNEITAFASLEYSAIKEDVAVLVIKESEVLESITGIPLATPLVPFETQQIFAIGYPFGTYLSQNEFPSPTIS